MTTLNPPLTPSLGTLPSGPRRAVNLQAFLAWYAQRAWQTLEQIGQRRAAPELRRAAARLAERHPDLARQLASTADDWSGDIAAVTVAAR